MQLYASQRRDLESCQMTRDFDCKPFMNKKMHNDNIIKNIRKLKTIIDQSKEDIAWTLSSHRYDKVTHIVEYEKAASNLSLGIDFVINSNVDFFNPSVILDQKMLDFADTCAACFACSEGARYRLAKGKFERKLFFSQQLFKDLNSVKSSID